MLLLSTDAAKQLQDTHSHLPKYTALLQPILADWTLPLLAWLLLELQVRHGKRGRQREGDPRNKNPGLLDQQARRLIKNREAAARSKLKKHKIPEQVGGSLGFRVMLIYQYSIYIILY
jgi:hypothetical protein